MAFTEKGAVSKGNMVFWSIFESLRTRSKKKAAVPAEIRLTVPTEDRIAYSETEFRVLETAAEAEILAAERNGEKRMIRIFQVDPNIIPDPKSVVPGTKRMVSKDNLHGTRKGLFGES